MKTLPRIGVVLLALVLATLLLVAVLDLPMPAINLPVQVAANMAQSGVEHPVTAVLLNFRGYDTLLEIAVLLLALLGMLAVAGTQAALHVRTDPAQPVRADPVLQALARLAVPLMILAAGYLLWAGAHRPGGAFQAGAVLAAAAVLLNLAGLLPAWSTPGRLLRLGLAGGFLLFLAVAAGLLVEAELLRYPPEHAGSLILLIEAGLTVSIGLILAGLFLLFSKRRAVVEET
jgi:multisubunit Na+/H+ antiporter MnhB subunit